MITDLHTTMLATAIIPVAVGCIFYSDLSDKFQLFILFMAFKMMSEVVALSTSMMEINNLPFLHYYTIIEFCFILLIFKDLIDNIKIPIGIMLIVGLCGIVSNTLEFNYIARTVEASFLVCVFFLLKSKITNNKELKMISMVMLFYYTFGFFLFFEMKSESKILMFICDLHLYLGAICNIGYTLCISVSKSLSDNFIHKYS